MGASIKRESFFIENALKWGHLTVPNEKDAVIRGTIIKADPIEIDKSNAKLRQICEPPGVWNDGNDDDDYYNDEYCD